MIDWIDVIKELECHDKRNMFLKLEEWYMHDTAIEMAKRMLVDSIWKSANLEGLGTTSH